MTYMPGFERFDGNLQVFLPYTKDIFPSGSEAQSAIHRAEAEAVRAIKSPVTQIHMAQKEYSREEISAMGAVTLAHEIFMAAAAGHLSNEEAKEYAARIASANLPVWGPRGCEAHLLYLGALEDVGHFRYEEDACRFDALGLPKIQTPYAACDAQIV